MLKEIVIAFQSYVKAHHFITKHKLWKWIVIPGVIYTLLFCVGMYFFIESSNTAVTWLSQFAGIGRWLHHQQSDSFNSQETAIDYLEKSVSSGELLLAALVLKSR